MGEQRRGPSAWRLWLGTLLFSVAVIAAAQDVSITREPRDSNLAVRLENLSSHVIYDRSGGTLFMVPTGRYSVQLLKDGRLTYQEVEYLGPDSPASRTVDPSGSGIIVGLSTGNVQFEPNPCSALQDAVRLAVGSFGIRDAQVQRRLANVTAGAPIRCATSDDVDSAGATLAGSYGVTPLGMVILSIEATPLSSRRYPPRGANLNLDTNSARPGISIAHQPASNLTASLVADLKNAASDVAVDINGKPFLVCAALDANTPLFCDSDGNVMAPSVNPHLATLYRLHVKTTPVDYHGVEEDHWTEFVSADQYNASQHQLAKALQVIQTSLLAGIEKVEAESFAVHGGGGGGEAVRYYPAPELTSLIVATQSEIDQVLQDVTLQPLRQALPRPIVGFDAHAQAAVPAPYAQKVFQGLNDTVGLLTYLAGNIGVDFIFRTTPVESESAQLTFDTCGRCTPIVSQGGQHRFYRGKYHIKVSRDGYLPYEGWLDLVQDPRTILECEMVRPHRIGNGQSSTCSLKTQ